MSGKQAKIQRKIARKQLTKEFGRDYALAISQHAVDRWEQGIFSAPLRLRFKIAWKIIKGKRK